MSILQKKSATYSAPQPQKVYSGEIKKKRRWVVLRRVVIVGFLMTFTLISGYTYAQIQQDKKIHDVQTAAIVAQKPDVYQLWTLTNNDRQAAQESLLALDPYLNTSAQIKCNDMIARGYFDHTTPDGATFDKLIRQYASGNVSTGENLIEGLTIKTAEDAENSWLASPGHRENILRSNYTKVGFATCSDGINNLVVAHFIGG